MCVLYKRELWKECGPLDGKEEARMENHFLSCACNKDGERRWVSCFGTVEVEFSPCRSCIDIVGYLDRNVQ